MIDSLEGYLDNIAAAATQTAAKGGPLAELAASLEISVDTGTIHQQEINRFYEQIKAPKKERNTGHQWCYIFRRNTTVCTHCEADM